MKLAKDKNDNEETSNSNTTKTQKEEKKPEPKTFAGDERPVAFMTDNNINAMPQAGLAHADLIYEIIVEGGETRLMMVMKNQDLKKIGPLRSARHYFIDYALENDAIYVHYGQSPQAKSDLEKLGINHINGIYESVTSFWRDNTRYAPHNALTSTANLKTIFEREGFKTTTTKRTVLKYVAEDFDLEPAYKENSVANESSEDSKLENTEVAKNKEITNLANTVTIPYSTHNTVKYTYNEESKTYTRYSRDTIQKDWNTGNAIEVKNIIITKCKNSAIDSYGRQTIDNIKTLDGYYITNGKYIPIKCEKTTRSGRTVYKDLKGNEINVNDGKTFIQICPIDSKISFQ